MARTTAEGAVRSAGPGSGRLGGCMRLGLAARHVEALLAVVQEGDDDSANLVCGQYGSLCKAAACMHERRTSCHCQYGLRGMLKKMRVEGQVRVTTNQGHVCMQHKNSENLR